MRLLPAKIEYLLRDQFLISVTPGSVNGTACTPGPGVRTVNDVESLINVTGGRLRSHGQTTAVWGDARITWPSVARANGRALVGLIDHQDGMIADMAFGLATANNIGNPGTDGYGWLGGLSAGVGAELRVAANGVSVLADAYPGPGIRSTQYLVVVAMLDTGAAILMSTFGTDDGVGWQGPLTMPKYPLARIVYVCRAGTVDPLFPYLQFYDEAPDATAYSSHGLTDLRVVDVASWQATDALATFADRFTRADSDTTMGNSWALEGSAGTWGIASNAAYNVSGHGSRAYHAITGNPSDGIWTWTVNCTTHAGTHWGLIFRRVDVNTFLYLTNNGAGNSIMLQEWQAGAFHGEVELFAGFTLPDGAPARIVVSAKGNQYHLWMNDIAGAATWKTDAGNYCLTGTSIGMRHDFRGTPPTFDNVAFYPHTVTLPLEIRDGAVPATRVAGATIAQDSFTDDDDTALDAHTAEAGGAWTEHQAAWTIQTNRASVVLGAGESGIATQELGVANCEMSLDVIFPAAYVGPAEVILSGIIVRYLNAGNYCVVRIARGAGTLNNQELEVLEVISGDAKVRHKTQFNVEYYALNGSYTLRVQAWGDHLQVWLDDNPVMSYIMQPALNGATRHGIFRGEGDSGPAFDNWLVKTLL
jgi:hypothetical protein